MSFDLCDIPFDATTLFAEITPLEVSMHLRGDIVELPISLAWICANQDVVDMCHRIVDPVSPAFPESASKLIVLFVIAYRDFQCVVTLRNIVETHP